MPSRKFPRRVALPFSISGKSERAHDGRTGIDDRHRLTDRITRLDPDAGCDPGHTGTAAACSLPTHRRELRPPKALNEVAKMVVPLIKPSSRYKSSTVPIALSTALRASLYAADFPPAPHRHDRCRKCTTGDGATMGWRDHTRNRWWPFEVVPHVPDQPVWGCTRPSVAHI